MKLLSLDIETSPNVAHVWDLWNQNISLAQLRESSELLCFSAKWLDNDHTMFFSEWDHGKLEMVRRAHELLSEADIVMHYNGYAFDIPYLKKEFILAGFTPPAPFQQIDLYKTVRQLKFTSRKLAYVVEALGLPGKIEHEGHELWVKVMAGDQTARDRMREYNVRDTELVEKLYEKLRPWITNHPSVPLIDGSTGDRCTRCGSDDFVKRVPHHTATRTYPSEQCNTCGGWDRNTRSVGGSTRRGII